MKPQRYLNAYNIKTGDLYESSFIIHPMEYVLERRNKDGRKIKQWVYLYKCLDVFGKTTMINTEHVKMIKSKECILTKCCMLRPKDENYHIRLNVHYNVTPLEFIHGY